MREEYSSLAVMARLGDGDEALPVVGLVGLWEKLHQGSLPGEGGPCTGPWTSAHL